MKTINYPSSEIEIIFCSVKTANSDLWTHHYITISFPNYTKSDYRSHKQTIVGFVAVYSSDLINGKLLTTWSPSLRRTLPVILGDLRGGFAVTRSGVFIQFASELAACLVLQFELASAVSVERVLSLSRDTVEASVREAIVVKAMGRSSSILSQRKFPFSGFWLIKSKFHRRSFSLTIRLSSSWSSLLSWSWSTGPNRFRQRDGLIPRSYRFVFIAWTDLATLVTLIPSKVLWIDRISLANALERQLYPNSRSINSSVSRSKKSQVFRVIFPVSKGARLWLAHSKVRCCGCLAIKRGWGDVYVKEDQIDKTPNLAGKSDHVKIMW